MHILNIVARHFNIKASILKGPRRLKNFIIPRHLAMYVMRNELKLPLEEIGAIFGGRDHTTVMYAVDKVTKLLSDSEGLRIELANVKKKIYG